MDDFDPHAEEMLEKSMYIVENLANYVDTFDEDELESIILMQQSMEFYIKQDDMNKAIIECRNLYNKIQQIIE